MSFTTQAREVLSGLTIATEVLPNGTGTRQLITPEMIDEVLKALTQLHQREVAEELNLLLEPIICLYARRPDEPNQA